MVIMRVWLDLHKTSSKHAHVLSGIFITNKKLLQKKAFQIRKKLDKLLVSYISSTQGSDPKV